MDHYHWKNLTTNFLRKIEFLNVFYGILKHFIALYHLVFCIWPSMVLHHVQSGQRNDKDGMVFLFIHLFVYTIIPIWLHKFSVHNFKDSCGRKTWFKYITIRFKCNFTRHNIYATFRRHSDSIHFKSNRMPLELAKLWHLHQWIKCKIF